MGTSISRIVSSLDTGRSAGKHAGSLKPFRETVRKRYRVERTNKAEIRLGEQSEKRTVVGRIYGMKYRLKGHKREIDTRTE